MELRRQGATKEGNALWGWSARGPRSADVEDWPKESIRGYPSLRVKKNCNAERGSEFDGQFWSYIGFPMRVLNMIQQPMLLYNWRFLLHAEEHSQYYCREYKLVRVKSLVAVTRSWTSTWTFGGTNESTSEHTNLYGEHGLSVAFDTWRKSCWPKPSIGHMALAPLVDLWG